MHDLTDARTSVPPSQLSSRLPLDRPARGPVDVPVPGPAARPIQGPARRAAGRRAPRGPAPALAPERPAPAAALSVEAEAGVDVDEVLALAQDTGRDQTYEFELYVLRWQRELAAAHAREAGRNDGPCALESFARREAAALRERMQRY